MYSLGFFGQESDTIAGLEDTTFFGIVGDCQDRTHNNSAMCEVKTLQVIS